MHNLINHAIRFTCKLAGKEEIPDDGTRVSEDVGAAEEKL
jgi:hypothetical protein